MYILVITIFILIFFLFGTTIIKLFASYSSNDYQKGNIWFISLLIINITIILFLYFYNNYITKQVGLKGNPGVAGNKGNDGDVCIIADPKCIYYEKYIKIPIPT
jgi:hypothetical protein